MANISDPENRGTMIFAWWMACICDAYSSVYYRRKPMLDDDDYDIDFYTAETASPESDSQKPVPSPRVQLEVAFCRCSPRLYLTSANSFWFVSPPESRMLGTKITKGILPRSTFAGKNREENVTSPVEARCRFRRCPVRLYMFSQPRAVGLENRVSPIRWGSKWYTTRLGFRLGQHKTVISIHSGSDVR